MHLFIPGGITDFPLEDALIFLKNCFNEGIFTNSRWAHNNNWFPLERCWIERTKVLLGEDKNIVLEQFQKLDNWISE